MNSLEMFEVGVFSAIMLFGITQVGMVIASYLWREKVRQWKAELRDSHSTLAKLELIIFF